nr:putative 3-phenylpropionic acid transporter [Candidatus Pantoea persica]
MVARLVGSLLIASQVRQPTQLVTALRLLALMTCLFAADYWVGTQWLLLVMVGFNLFFSPLVPLSNVLAATWTQQIGLKY